MTMVRRAVACAALVLLVLTGTAYGGSEADQRKAFISFLEYINKLPGVRFEKPTPEQEKTFGDYQKQYDLLVNFNNDLGAIFRDLINRMKEVGVSEGVHRSISELAAHRDEVAAIRPLIEKTIGQLEVNLAKLDSERAAYQQPDDLKAVYARTVDRLITKPAQAMEHSYKMLDEALASSVRLADFINSHKDKVTITPVRIIASDQETLDQVQALFTAQVEAAKRFREAQRSLHTLLVGY